MSLSPSPSATAAAAQRTLHSATDPLARDTIGRGKVVHVQQMLWRALSSGPRELLGRLMGTGFGGKRDYYAVFGWDRSIDSRAMWQMYARGGIARRIVHAYPDAIWASPPEVQATQAFKKSWEELVLDQNLWSVLHRLDRLSRIGQYCVLLVGMDDTARLDQPVNTRRANNVLYLQPYSDRSAVITKWGTDPTDARFGLPVEYTIYPGCTNLEDRNGGQGSAGQSWQAMMPGRASFKVHYSRVIHYARGGLENDIFGIPDLWASWNYLTDLMKVVGGSSESYWMTANRGMHADLDKDIEMDAADEAGLAEELDEYQHGIRRFIRTRGVTVKALGSEIADPTGPFETLLTLISGTHKIPKRILVGSESAHNASTQDKGAWAEAVDDERRLYSGPGILRPTIQALQMFGFLPAIKPSKLAFEWPDAYVLSPLEESQRGNQRATALNNLAMATSKVSNLASVEELREIAGLPEVMKGSTIPKLVVAPVAKGGRSGSGDGGSATRPTKNPATTGSDANGAGAATPGRKATNK